MGGQTLQWSLLYKDAESSRAHVELNVHRCLLVMVFAGMDRFPATHRSVLANIAGLNQAFRYQITG
jgi:hypothetical protein